MGNNSSNKLLEKSFIRSLRSNSEIKKIILLALFIVFVTILAAIYAINNRYATGIDSISYISIAENYADRRFDLAINAYWAPITSWLIALFMLVGIEGQLSFVAFNIFTVLSILIISTLIVWKNTNKSFVLSVLCLLLLSPFLITAIPTQQPDLLVVAWVILGAPLLLWADKSMYPAKKYAGLNNKIVKSALIVGLYGGIAFLIKLFLLPFFFTVVFIWLIYNLISNQYLYNFKTNFKILIKHLLLITIGFIVIFGPWVILLSLKYDRFMVGSSFLVTIGSRFNSDLLTNQEYLPEPPNSRAVSIGEDRTPNNTRSESINNVNPNVVNKLKDLKTEDGYEKNISTYINERIKAFPFYLNRINSLSVFILPLFSTVFFLFLLGIFKYKNKELFFLFVLFVVYFSGYGMITAVRSGGGNLRYYWPLYGLFSILFPILIYNLSKLIKITSKLRRVILVILIISVPAVAWLQFILGYYYPFSIPINNPVGLRDSNKSETINFFKKEEVPISVILPLKIKTDKLLEEGSKIVSNNFRQAVKVAYYNDSSVYGISGMEYDYNDPFLQKLMKEKEIDFFIKFTPKRKYVNGLTDLEQNNFVKRYEEVVGCDDKRSTSVVSCVIEIFRVEK